MPAVRKSRHKRRTKPALTCTVDDIVLKPTVIFDTFWRFCAERKSIDEKRREGQAPSWTDDVVLRAHRFCNVFRVSDRHSQYLICEVIEKGRQNPVEVTFRVLLFNAFTNIGTYELLVRALGSLTWAKYDKATYRRVLQDAKEDGVSLYTGSFQKPAPKMGHKEAYLNHLEFLEVLMECDLPSELANCAYMADAFEWLLAFPGMGNFNAYQLLLDLSYSNVINFSDTDFVVAGPGACSGLRKCFGRSPLKGNEAAIIRWMYETQDEHFARLGLTFNGLGPDHLRMQLCDIEHTLCEVDKYARVAHRKVLGLLGGQAKIRQAFVPSDNYEHNLHLPKAWSHPDRQVMRIRARPLAKVEKRYIVDRITDSRTRDGRLEYRVRWIGYPASDSTWEPADSLTEDAPLAVHEFNGQN